VYLSENPLTSIPLSIKAYLILKESSPNMFSKTLIVLFAVFAATYAFIPAANMLTGKSSSLKMGFEKVKTFGYFN
jgi:hypothetical protein